MAGRQVIVDPYTDDAARVLNGGALEVITDGLPPQGAAQKAIIFRDYFRNAAGSEDMRVDGSVTPVEFVIRAPITRDVDRYVKSLSFVIADAGASLNQFGNIGVLANGVEFEYSNLLAQGGVVSLGLGGLTTNFSFIELCLGTPAFGDGGTVFRANNVSGNSEAYIPALYFENFGLPNGVLLRGGTNDRLVLRINDDITGVDQFTCVANGFDRGKVRPNE